ncbi:MAG: hypothetical protein NTZ55_02400, partial [Candidatus Roizmanbacteria bacterium]|nr:hypothetical protein [Candidatus Roizmanbacteria bacterium]
MFTKRSKPASKAPVASLQEQSETLDVSKMLDQLESTPIMTKENSYEAPQPEQKPVVSAPSVAAAPVKAAPLEERLKEDLKMSYPAKGILDVTFGGYGFLRKDYVINPDNDIYVSTSQIRRFWLRKGDEVEGLARPAKEGERFHSLLLIKKING